LFHERSKYPLNERDIQFSEPNITDSDQKIGFRDKQTRLNVPSRAFPAIFHLTSAGPARTSSQCFPSPNHRDGPDRAALDLSWTCYQIPNQRVKLWACNDYIASPCCIISLRPGLTRSGLTEAPEAAAAAAGPASGCLRRATVDHLSLRYAVAPAGLTVLQVTLACRASRPA
jgi:hypothetical protein